MGASIQEIARGHILALVACCHSEAMSLQYANSKQIRDETSFSFSPFLLVCSLISHSRRSTTTKLSMRRNLKTRLHPLTCRKGDFSEHHGAVLFGKDVRCENGKKYEWYESSSMDA